MTRDTRTTVRLAVTGGIVLALIVGQNIRAESAPNELPKVEFTEVEGRQCLQPVLHGDGAQLTDYRAAEMRWLRAKYPGVPVPEAKTEILLSPATDGAGKPKSTTVRRETFYLDGIVGAGAATCFDINVVTSPDEAHDERPSG
jgi:hypothetical protein